ncbi:hypothetical protein HanXRQr2_Chr16g0738651 [Helianthus annuus]|uniref:Uncharacterized protein n=1 Tax=Helianthus annuus TaxID=4232 RepID=A0A9K3GZG2_HELAN|nr:hypothetical protein HanXRQr2_Chr16g0738651 [Helianthus annuus]KAJ0437456.1 hypothetical protein HanHA300_Chr16g0602381 [Helianthus annuus]KAJ0459774.1 hypothetical protein HanHA89_Chr16g0652901 [Helianthus annuus]
MIMCNLVLIFFSTTQEIVREWRSMGEEIMDFENSKKSLVAEREAFNSEKKGLMWRVADAEEKLSQEKQLNADRQKDWVAACERSNHELKTVHDEVVRVKAERAKESQEFDRISAAYKEKEAESFTAQKGNEEAQAWIVELEKTVEEQKAQNKTLELLSQDLVMIASGSLCAAFPCGRKDRYAEGKAAALAKEKDDKFELFKVDCVGNYTANCQEYEFVEFGILKAIDKLARRGVVVETLKKVIEDSDAEAGTGGASSSHQP